MAGKRILVVDDQEMVLQSVKMTLAHAGHKIETAATGAEALRKFSANTFDIVLTDWKLMDMTGDCLAREFKKQNPLLPIVLISGFPPDKQPVEFSRILLKPFSAEELRNVVAELGLTQNG
jgi:two-component system, cell cycle sensor histidine kinase and response regulator CckA